MFRKPMLLGSYATVVQLLLLATPVIGETVSTPTIAGPTNGQVGVQYTFEATGASSSEEHGLFYKFSSRLLDVTDWSDDTYDSPNVSEVGFTEAGTWQLRVRARCRYGHAGAESPWSATHSIVISNQPSPETVSTPTIAGPTNGQVGVQYTFEATGASSSEGHGLHYQFSRRLLGVTDWSDDTYDSPNVSEDSFMQTGTWQLRVRARCQYGHTGAESGWSATHSINITDTPPPETVSTPTIDGPTAGVVGTQYEFEATGASSSEGHGLHYQFSRRLLNVTDWSDDTYESSNTSQDSFAEAGTWQFRVRARCAYGHAGAESTWSATHSINITDTPPPETVSTPTIDGATAGVVGTQYEFEATGASSSKGHPLHYQFSRRLLNVTDWSDDTYESSNISQDSFAEPGTWELRVRARCAYGHAGAESSWSATHSINITDEPADPTICVTPALDQDFGLVAVGSAAETTFTVENCGGGTLVGSASGLASPFSLVGNTSYTLTAGQTKAIRVRFAPTSDGIYSDTIEFSGGGAALGTISGYGVGPEDCAPSCPEHLIGNGNCDPACNNEECKYDGRDCEPPPDDCAPGCPEAWIGNGVCNPACYNSSCGWDGTDCPLSCEWNVIDSLRKELERLIGTTPAEHYENGTKYLVYVGGDIKYAAGVGVTVFIDLNDFMALTPEGKDGWVTMWLEISGSLGVGAEAHLGVVPKAFKCPDEDPFLLDFGCDLESVTFGAFSAKLATVKSTGSDSCVADLEFTPGVGVAVISCGLPLPRFEVKRSDLEPLLLEVVHDSFIALRDADDPTEALVEVLLAALVESSPLGLWEPSLPVRPATRTDTNSDAECARTLPPPPPGGLCGTGVVGMLPLVLLTLISMKFARGPAIGEYEHSQRHLARLSRMRRRT